MAPSRLLPLLCLLLVRLAAAAVQQNIQSFFPSTATPAFVKPPPFTTSPPMSTRSSSPSSTRRTDIAVAVVTTALTSFALSTVAFCLFLRYARKEGAKRPCDGAFMGTRREWEPRRSARVGMVDENGLEEMCWRDFEEESDGMRTKPRGNGWPPQPQRHCVETEEAPPPSPPPPRKDKIDHDPLAPWGSLDYPSTACDESPRPPSAGSSSPFSVGVGSVPLAPPGQAAAAASASTPMSPPPGRASLQQQPLVAAPSVQPPPPPQPRNGPPPPPPLGCKKGVPLPNGGALASPSRPPAAPGTATGAGERPAKLKPLHWDKVNVAATEHSMVWDRITGGSFNLDESTMEALFATAATNRRLVPSDSNYPSSGGSSCGRGRANSTEQVSLLEPRKSHNIAIVLRSLAVGWDEVIDALRDGHADLSADVLEKLGKLNVSKDEASAILRFSGDTDGLAPAESFVFRLLLDVRDPFARIEALHFRASYGAEAARLRQSLQTLELASQEMRTKGLFYKLLEAVLKAGNRMNAGTARGNAQAFNLAALCKLSDVKSTDGITTLLHFVVEEVVRAEGKRRAVNRTHSLGRSGSLARAAASDDGGGPAPGPTREERQNEYMNVGLPVVRGLGAEFANVKSAASVDYDAVVSDIIELGRQLGDIKKLFDTCEDDNEDGFTRVMRGFAKNVEEELMALKEEQERVQELVRRTTEYYHAGATNDKSTPPLQLFVVVRDFLDMVDKACVDINRKLQQKKPPPPSPSQQPTTTTAAKVAVQEVREVDDSRKKRVMPRFPNLPARFMKDSAESDSSSDED